MVALIVIFLVIGIVAALISAVFGLDFETVFLWCVIIVGALVLLVFLNPLYWRAYREEREEEKRKREVVLRDWCRMNRREMRRVEKQLVRKAERDVDDYLDNGAWQYELGGGYERMSPTKGYQRLSEEEYNDLLFK